MEISKKLKQNPDSCSSFVPRSQRTLCYQQTLHCVLKQEYNNYNLREWINKANYNNFCSFKA